MASRKSKQTKSKKKLLGNDPFEKGAATRPGSIASPPEKQRSNTPELVKSNTPAKQAPLSPPGERVRVRADDSVAVPHESSPTLADITPHAASPIAADVVAHASSPVAGDVIAHAASPSAPDVIAHDASPELVETEPIREPTSAPRAILRAIRSSLGLSSAKTTVDRWGRDESLTTSLQPLAKLLYDRYWRVQVEGADNVPRGPCVIVANHAGALPLDGPILHLALRRERPDLAGARWLLEDQVFHAPFVGVFANRLGAVRASPENALRILEEQRPLIVFPEGFQGLSKPFSERYQLRRFGRGGSVKIALRAKVPIVPVAIVGGEESMPLFGKLPGGLFGVEYLPLTLPPLPAKWTIRFGAPLSMEGAPQNPDDDLAWVERTNTTAKERIESMLAELLSGRTNVF